MSASREDDVNGAFRRVLLFADVVGYSRSVQSVQHDLQERLLACLDEASTEAGLHRAEWVRQGSGDGELAVLPSSEHETRVVGDLVRKLGAALRRTNLGMRPEARLRVRLAIHFGPAAPAQNGFAGRGVVEVSRLVDAEVVRHAAESTESHLVVVLSDDVYRDTVLQQLTDFDPDEFRRVRIAHKEYSADAWLWTSDGKVGALDLAPSRAGRQPPPIRALPGNNLPLITDAFVGRTNELETARRDILERKQRLLTVVGSPGVGKTRFAQELARGLLHRFEDHVYVVDLSAVADPDLVINTITRALKVDVGDPVLDALKQIFHGVEALLVLDSMEQVLSVSTTIRELLEAAPGLHVVATSQEPLMVRGEHKFELHPMTIEQAVDLFRERAGHGGHSAEPPDPDVMTICRRLDNLPLAVELVAARAQFYTPTQLLGMLTSEMLDVAATHRDASERQRSLRSAFNWSYKLLQAAEQALFRRLGVFQNGWTLESAVVVLREDDEPDWIIAERMRSLLTKSLLQASPSGQARYQMLRTLQPYAVELLDRDPEAGELRERHARHYLRLATDAAQADVADDGSAVLHLEADQDNISAALTYFVSRRRSPEALDLALAQSGYWLSRDYAEGWSRLREVLAAPCPADLRVRRAELLIAAGRLGIRLGRLHDAERDFSEALAHAGESAPATQSKAASGLALVAMERTDFTTARSLLVRALALQEASGDRAGLADTLDGLGTVLTGEGEYEQAAVRLQDSLAMYESLRSSRGAAWVHNDLARLCLATGHTDEAREHASRALDTGVALGDPGLVAWATNYLGHIASRCGDHAKSKQLHLDSLAAVMLLGDKRPTALALEGRAALAAQQGAATLAVALSEAALDVRDKAGVPRTAAEQHMMDGGVAGGGGVSWAYEQLTSAELSRAIARGRGLSLEQAVGLAREE